MIKKYRILYTKILSDHRRSLLEQMVDVTEVQSLDPVLLPIVEMPPALEWVIITSPHALDSIRTYVENGWGKDSKWATVGYRSRDKIAELGIESTIQAHHTKELVSKLPEKGDALYLCGKDRTNTIETFMSSGNWNLQTLETYWTQATHPHVNLTDFDAVIFFSPRNTDSILRHNPWPANGFAIAIGPTTAQALEEKGITPQIVPKSPDVLILTQQFLEIQQNGSSK